MYRGKSNGWFDLPKVERNVACLSNLFCGSKFGNIAGFISLTSVTLFEGSKIRFASYDELKARAYNPMTYRRTLPFVGKSTYLFPSVTVSPEEWDLLARRTSQVLNDYLVSVARDHGVPLISVWRGTYLSNITLTRAVMKHAEDGISLDNVGRFSDVIPRVLYNPDLSIEYGCSFCVDNDDLVSNYAKEKYGKVFAPYLVTQNDLSCEVEDARMDCPWPRLFRHPRYQLLSIWCATDYSDPSTHSLTYEKKVSFRHRVMEKGQSEPLPPWDSEWGEPLYYFHHTLTDTNAPGGWHAHTSMCVGGMVRLRYSAREWAEVTWPEYVILCSTFNWLRKVYSAYTGREENLTKFSELPYPLAEVYAQVGEMKSSKEFSKFGAKAICLQGLILATAAFPRDILQAMRKGFSMQKLWFAMYTFLRGWNIEGSQVDQWMRRGFPRIHKQWFEITSLKGDEFPVWFVVTEQESLDLTHDICSR